MVAHGLPNHSGTHAGCLLFVLMSAYIHMLWHCMRSEHDYSTLLVTLFDFLIYIYIYVCVYMYMYIYIYLKTKNALLQYSCLHHARSHKKMEGAGMANWVSRCTLGKAWPHFCRTALSFLNACLHEVANNLSAIGSVYHGCDKHILQRVHVMIVAVGPFATSTVHE